MPDEPRSAPSFLAQAAAMLAASLVILVTPPAFAQPNCTPVTGGALETFYDGIGASIDFDAVVFADGSGVAVWSGSGVGIGDDSRLAVVARGFGPSGSPSGSRFVVNTLTDEDQFEPRIAGSPDGRFVIVWQSDTSPGDGERSSIRARVFGKSGAPIGADFQVNTSTSGDQVDPEVGMASNGDFVVVWYDDADAPGSSDKRGREVRARRFSADGTPRGGDFVVNELTAGAQNQPAVAMRGDGSFVVTWKSTSTPGDDVVDASIQARLFAADGQPKGGQLQVNDSTPGSQETPAIAMDADGSFLIAWVSPQSEESDHDGRSVHARGFLAGGAPVGGQRQVNSGTADDQEAVQVAAAGAREFLVVWRSDEVPLQPTVKARGLTLGGTALGGEVSVGNIADSHPEPGVGGNGAGSTIIVFDQISAVRALTVGFPCGVGGGAGGCTEGPTTLCLTDGRFRVTAIWHNPQGDSGEGRSVRLTPDTGYFWFFDSANVETVVKVLDACGFNGRFWVFIGGLTDLRVEFVIEDTESGFARSYENPLGAAFLTVNDTAGFDTCF